MAKKRKKDWRSLPRKPAADKATAQLRLRLTAQQHAEIKAAAESAGLTVTRYVLDRCVTA